MTVDDSANESRNKRKIYIECRKLNRKNVDDKTMQSCKSRYG